jgi:hypothetical protein
LILNVFIFSAQFKDKIYYFCVNLYGLIKDDNVTNQMSFEGLHIKAEKLFKTGKFIIDK